MISPPITMPWPTSAALRTRTTLASPAHSLDLSSAVGPVVFVLDDDPTSLDVLLADLTRRFGNDFTVTGDTSSGRALSALQRMVGAREPAALILVNDEALDFLARAHELHPRAKRVLLVDRDYSSTSPAVQAITLGHAEYHLVRPWFDERRCTAR